MTKQYQNLRDLVDYATSPTKKKKGIAANLWTTAGFLDYYITGLSWSPRRTNWRKNTNTENTRTVKCKGYYLFSWRSNLPKPGFCLFINEVLLQTLLDYKCHNDRKHGVPVPATSLHPEKSWPHCQCSTVNGSLCDLTVHGISCWFRVTCSKQGMWCVSKDESGGW